MRTSEGLRISALNIRARETWLENVSSELGMKSSGAPVARAQLDYEKDLAEFNDIFLYSDSLKPIDSRNAHFDNETMVSVESGSADMVKNLHAKWQLPIHKATALMQSTESPETAPSHPVDDFISQVTEEAVMEFEQNDLNSGEEKNND